MPALEIRASLGHLALDLLLGPVLARADNLLLLSNLALPHLQPFEFKAMLHGFQRQHLLTLSDLFLLGGRPPQRRKGSPTCLHLLIQDSAPGLELPCAFLRGLATAVSFTSLL